MYIIPVSLQEDVFVTFVIAWWIYELFHLCACCQRFCVGIKAVHGRSGRQGKVNTVYWISEKIDITKLNLRTGSVKCAAMPCMHMMRNQTRSLREGSYGNLEERIGLAVFSICLDILHVFDLGVLQCFLGKFGGKVIEAENGPAKLSPLLVARHVRFC